MSAVTFTPAMADRLAELFGLFKLPTMAAQTTRRLEKAGHADALALLLEVAEMESGDRRERRIDRLRRASMLPPGKTLDAFDLARLPRGIASKLHELRRQSKARGVRRRREGSGAEGEDRF
jgi:hypothetical protein